MTEYLETLTKIGLYAGLLTLVGGSTAYWIARAASEDAASQRRLRAAALASAVVVLVFLLFRLAAHTWAAFGSDGVFVDNLQTIGLRSRWGRAWRLQAIAAIVVLGLTAWARRGQVLRAAVASLAAVGLAAAYSRTGHSAGSAATGAAATIHMIAGGAWLGTLGVLVVTGHRGAIWNRFSAVALSGAGGVVLSGLVLASSYLTSPRDLLDTPYGRLFVLKILLFLAIAGCGFLNWRQVSASSGSEVRPKTACLEFVLAIALVVVTAFLTETEHPVSGE